MKNINNKSEQIGLKVHTNDHDHRLMNFQTIFQQDSYINIIINIK